MPDYAGMLDAIYDALGVDATIGSVGLTVIDKTEGVMLESGNGLQFATAKPAACVRVSELQVNEIAREALKGATLTFNGNAWKIVQTQPKPKPGTPGELYLILQQGA